jgi:hypothetical protein
MLWIKRASSKKVNSTVALTLILLILMLIGGYVSAIWGYAIGHEAIEGVNQPDARPASKIGFRKNKSKQQGVVLLKEADILAAVKARIDSRGKKAKPEKPLIENPQDEKQSSTKTKLVADTETPQPGFPMVHKTAGVTLEVTSARFSGGALQLKMNFKNEGDRTVKFPSSFLDVTDERGQTLSANTEGFPEELPANGKTFAGTASISTALLENVQKISLKLTDYPEQRLQLQMLNIPVVKEEARG